MKKQRLSYDDRRREILETALPLFAEIGFRGATTKMIAQRAGVSEALLYQHFPSKDVLYAEAQDFLCQQQPAFATDLAVQPACTETLVYLIYLIARFLLDPPVVSDISQVLPRVMLQSLLDDGTFARLHLERNLQPLIKLGTASIKAARNAGELLPNNEISDELRFLLAHHVFVMVSLGNLPSTRLFDYPGNKQFQFDQVIRFALCGIGIANQAINKYFDAATLNARLLKDLGSARSPEENK